MKRLRLAIDIVYWLAIVLLVVIALGTAFSVLEAPGGYRAFVVQSGSMQPAIKAGAVVLVMPQEEYKKDEVITFLINPRAELKKPGSTVTHRIVEAHDDEGRLTFTTKGDANQSEDREAVVQSQVLGKVIFNIPYLGYAVDFAKTQTGFIALIVVPGTLIIYSELMSVKKEVTRMIREFKEKKLAKGQSSSGRKKELQKKKRKKSRKSKKEE